MSFDKIKIRWLRIEALELIFCDRLIAAYCFKVVKNKDLEMP